MRRKKLSKASVTSLFSSLGINVSVFVSVLNTVWQEIHVGVLLWDLTIAHVRVVCLLARPLIESEVEVIETSPLFIWNHLVLMLTSLHVKRNEVCIKTKSARSLSFTQTPLR